MSNGKWIIFKEDEGRRRPELLMIKKLKFGNGGEQFGAYLAFGPLVPTLIIYYLYFFIIPTTFQRVV